MTVGIVGLGLMGASFALSIKRKGEDKVFGFDKDQSVLLKASLLNCIDGELNEQTVGQVDLLIISVYPRDFSKVCERFLPFMKDGAIVIDFCGNKVSVCDSMKKLSKKYQNVWLLGGHPMAGREFSGIDRAIKTLFDKASMILIPVKADIFIEEKIKKYFLELGFAEVVFTDAETHDKNIAFTSQLCHVVSNAFIKSDTAKLHHGFSAGSYKDLTRVARLNSNLWSQLMIDNAENLSCELKTLIDNLSKYYIALENKDQEELKKLLEDGNLLKIEIDARNKK